MSYGIDLGTSNCLIATVEENLDGSFEVICLSDDDGNESFPSVVYFEDEHTYQVGDKALYQLLHEPDSTVELIKIRLGKSNEIPVKVKGARQPILKTPQEVSSYLLRHFNTLHHGEISEAVLTVPAFFDQNQKDATKQAGQLAGINIREMIEEPSAAIMYHLFSQYKEHGIDWFQRRGKRNVLVFDFGGGTLDLSLISVECEGEEVKPRVLFVGGDNELGGNIIDFVFVRHILEYLCLNYRDDGFIQEVKRAYEDYYDGYINHKRLRFPADVSPEIKNFILRLKRNLENVKIQLSTREETTIVFERIYAPLRLTRKQFEDVVLKDRKLNVKARIEAALSQMSRQREVVHEVLLVGGSAQIPYLSRLITDVLGEMNLDRDHIMTSQEYDKSVVKGAAILGAIADGMEIPPFRRNRCRSIVARDIELQHVKGEPIVFVEKGTEYPFPEKKEYIFNIGHALSETVDLMLNEVIETPGKASERKPVVDFTFHLPIYYTGDQIRLYLQINEDGLYQVEAVHDETNEYVEYEPQRQFSLSEDDFEKVRKQVEQSRDIT
jgi:molecular chaperone DnaK